MRKAMLLVAGGLVSALWVLLVCSYAQTQSPHWTYGKVSQRSSSDEPQLRIPGRVSAPLPPLLPAGLIMYLRKRALIHTCALPLGFQLRLRIV